MNGDTFVPEKPRVSIAKWENGPRYAIRSLVRRPLFTAVIVLTLAAVGRGRIIRQMLVGSGVRLAFGASERDVMRLISSDRRVDRRG